VTPRSVFASAPIGVLVIGVLLLLLGAGLVVGGVVLLLAGGPGPSLAWLAVLAAGPLAIYLSLHFVYGRRWAWTAVVSLLVFILASGVARAAVADGVTLMPLLEAAVSLGCLAYLFRAHVRRGFAE
jgi:hypothetical protein